MTFLDFSRRSSAAEWMDDPTTDYSTFRDCLIDLAKANRWTLGHRPTLRFLDRLHRQKLWPAERPLRLLDVGSGYGDLVRAVDSWAARRRLKVELIGLDLNPWSARAAASATPTGSSITWMTADAFESSDRADVITCGLFTHHLADPLVSRFLRLLDERAEIGWFVNDLHRHPLAYFGFAALSKVMGWHSFVQHDGPISVARAFSPGDWKRLINSAALDPQDIEISWWLPFRLCLARIKRPG